MVLSCFCMFVVLCLLYVWCHKRMVMFLLGFVAVWVICVRSAALRVVAWLLCFLCWLCVQWCGSMVAFFVGLVSIMVIWLRSGGLKLVAWFGLFVVFCLVVCAVVWVCGSVPCGFRLECGELGQIWWVEGCRLVWSVCGVVYAVYVGWYGSVVLSFLGFFWNVVIWVRSAGLVVFGWFGVFDVLCLVVCAVVWVCGSVPCGFRFECGDLCQMWWVEGFRLFGMLLALVECAVVWVCGYVLCGFNWECGVLGQICWFGWGG